MFLSLDAALKPYSKNGQKACLMLHLFPSTFILMHCIPVQVIKLGVKNKQIISKTNSSKLKYKFVEEIEKTCGDLSSKF